MPKNKLHGRWYGDACGAAFAMELVGERWTLLLVRELLLGARRFSDLRAALGGISAKTLTERLESLIDAAVVVRRELPPPGKARVYELTRWGYAAEPLIQEAGRWAVQSSAHDPMLPLSPVALMISLRTMVDKSRMGRVKGRVGFVIGEDSFVAQAGKGELEVRRGDAGEAGAVLRAPTATPLAALIYHKVPAADLAASGLEIAGDTALAERFVDLFALPPKLSGA